jgi:hypothetical protein
VQRSRRHQHPRVLRPIGCCCGLARHRCHLPAPAGQFG